MPLSTLPGQAGRRQFNSRDLVGEHAGRKEVRGAGTFLPLEPKVSEREQVRGRNFTLSSESHFSALPPKTAPSLSILNELPPTTLKHPRVMVLFRPCPLLRTLL